MFETDNETAYRVRLTLTRGKIADHDDSPMMQTVTFRGLQNELLTAERFQSYGHTSVPVPPTDAAGQQAPEVVVAFVGGDRSHPVVVATDDRRFRMKNLKAGDVATHDNRGQYSHLSDQGHTAVAKNHSITAGSQSDTGDHEINNQLRGSDARLSQLERNLHGLFDVTSRLNTIAMGAIPALAQLAPILTQTPDGLDQMEQAILAKAPAYLQKQISQALGKFGASPMAAVASVLGGGIEGLISAAISQIANLVSANPIISTVDSLVAELAALNGSASPAVIAQTAPVIQGLIDSATASNPIIGQVANLRSELASLVTGAGDGLNFLAPQQRMAQGLSKSLKLSQ